MTPAIFHVYQIISNQVYFPISRGHVIHKNKAQKLKGGGGSAREAEPAYQAGGPWPISKGK